MRNLCLCISGGASTACAIIESAQRGKLMGLINPALVIASHDKVSGMENIRKLRMPGLPVVVIDRAHFDTPEGFGHYILMECAERGIDLFGQYGWLEKTPPNVVAHFRGRSVNQHPAPLDPGYPDFGGPGVHGLRAHFLREFFVVRAGRREDYFTEATAHRVEDEFDKGEVIGRSAMEFAANITPEQMSKELLPLEHALQIDVLRDFALDQVKVLRRERRLVLPGEEHILADGLVHARRKYPYKRIS